MLAGLRRSKALCLSEGQTLTASIVNGLLGPFPRVGRLLVVWAGGLLARPAAFERDSSVDEPEEACSCPSYCASGSMGLAMNRQAWLLSSCWVGRAWFASNRLRYSTFFKGNGRRTVKFFNLWLACLAQGACLRAIAALALATNIRHGCKMPVSRRLSRAGLRSSQKN